MAGALRSLAGAVALTVGALAFNPASALAAPDQPNWKYFTNVPRLDGNDDDRRVIGCFPLGSMQVPCTVNERTTAAAATAAWDTPDGSSASTITTSGRYADTALSAFSPVAPGPDRLFRPTRVDRDYFYPFTDQWRNSSCNPSNFSSPTSSDGGSNTNDINAAIVNLFVAHNHMHDWSFGLGFTPATFNMEATDRVLGDAQASAKTGLLTFSGRDAADHATPADGISPAFTTYLWQPIAGVYYPQCVDGSFDMSLMAHQYGHAIANRMVGGAAAGLTSSSDGQALAIGEGFADLAAVEYLHEHGYAPADDEDPFAVGAYVTGNRARGVRNYSMAHSPLNYSNLRGWDGNGGSSPADDGEIWAAVNHDIRSAFVARYGAGGAPRWMRLAFDALPLMPANATMVQARDAYLAASTEDDLLWSAFAKRGLGEHAASTGTEDADPKPSFESLLRADESTVVFAPGVKAELFVGDHEAGTTPVADTDPATPLGDTFKLLPGDYSFLTRGDGYGAQRFERDIPASSTVRIDQALPPNRASAAAGALISGDGTRQGALIDDTEESNWEVTGAPVADADVTVDLAGGAQVVQRVNVSALLKGTDDGEEEDAAGNQNRFTALRQFALYACTASAGNGNCTAPGSFPAPFFTSSADAFPGAAPRPVTPDLNLRSFDVPDTTATHVRLAVMSNQCTGPALFNDPGLDNDDATTSDCTVGNAGIVTRKDQTVRAAEFQVFSTLLSTGPGTTGPGADAPPKITRLSLSKRRFRRGRALPRAAAAPKGTTIRVTLSEAASVKYTFARALPGRRLGRRRCVAPRRVLRSRPRCTRYVTAGTLKRAAKAGANRLRFEGRLTRRRSLRPGQYRLTAVATDAAGQRSSPRTTTFTLLAR